MWEMMLPYFNGLEEGEALKQFNEQFPNGIEQQESAEDLKNYYNQLAQAIINDEDSDQSVIETFRKETTAKNEISQGRHFNLNHLFAASRAYVDNFRDIDDWDKLDIFWIKVICYVQRQMTAYDAQVYCSGFQSALVNDTKISRSLSFVDNNGKFFPLERHSGLGFDFGTHCVPAAGRWHVCKANRVSLATAFFDSRAIEKFYATKTNELAELKGSLERGVRYQPK